MKKVLPSMQKSPLVDLRAIASRSLETAQAAAAVLEEIAEGRDDPAGFRIWTRR